MQLVDSLKLSKIIFSITLAFMVLLSYLSFERIQTLIEYGKLVDETNQLKYKMEQCLSYVKDAETGQRGYLLTRDATFLRPMHIAATQIYPNLNELSVLALADKENIQLIHEFKNACINRMIYIEKLASENNSPESYAGENEGKLLWGKQMMDEAREMANAINKNLEKKLTERETIKNRYVTITPIFMIALSLASIFLILLAYRIIDKELKKRVAMQKELQYNMEALSRSNSELEQFAYVASHDLQEPLRKIQSFGSRLILKHSDNLDVDAQFIIGRMQNAGERMQSLINDLLAYSRLSNSKTKKFTSIDLNQSLANVLEILNDEIIKKEAVVNTTSLPTIEANGSQMEQLFQNLLTNALKFMPENRKPVITIHYSEIPGKEIPSVKPVDLNKRFHKISVADNGIGFEDQYREKIFVIFQRLQGKTEFSGSGIGLAICKKIILNHDGYIIASSRLEQGSEFSICFPES